MRKVDAAEIEKGRSDDEVGRFSASVERVGRGGCDFE
jgi:hypothetical protein